MSTPVFCLDLTTDNVEIVGTKRAASTPLPSSDQVANKRTAITTPHSRSDLLSPSTVADGPRSNPRPAAPALAPDYAADFIREYARLPRQLSSGDVKKYFFLNADDLSTLPFERGGWGSGQLKIFSTETIRQYAVRKFGQDGLHSKIQSQAEKFAKKMRKEDAAAAAGRALQATGTTQVTAIAPDVSDTLKSVRKGIIQQIKQNLGKAENGGPFRVEVPGVSKAVFAALIKRPTDLELASVPKNGAFYSLGTNLETILAIRSAKEIQKCKYGTDFCAHSDCVVKYKPSSMLLSVSGYGSVDYY